MCICQFINNRFIRNFNNCHVALKTRWGMSDTLDCHMGVTWFDAARWLAASRMLIIFFIKILRYVLIPAIIPLYSDQTWKWIVLSSFYTLWKYFCWVWRPYLRKAAPWQHADILREKYCPQHWSGSCHRPLNSPPEELHLTCCCRAIFQLNGVINK